MRRRCDDVLVGWTTILATFVFGLGCNSIATEKVPNTEGTDRIWASAKAFCARKPNALICWEAAPGNLLAREPTVLEGVGSVSAVALRETEGCAISDLGIGCFRVSDQQLARAKGVPNDFVAFGKGKKMFCARDNEGVRCFSDKIEHMKPAPAFEKPKLLHATLEGSGACGEYEYELRCFTTDEGGNLKATLRIRGVRGARAVRIDEEKGFLLVLDGSGLKFAKASAEAAKGRALNEEPAKNFPPAATVELADVEGVLDAKKLTSDGGKTYVLDAQGVKAIALSDKGLEQQLWPLAFSPADFWQGKGDVFFAAHDGELTMHGWKDGERFGKPLRGIENPKDVASGDDYTCVVHDGGVNCVQN